MKACVKLSMNMVGIGVVLAGLGPVDPSLEGLEFVLVVEPPWF